MGGLVGGGNDFRHVRVHAAARRKRCGEELPEQRHPACQDGVFERCLKLRSNLTVRFRVLHVHVVDEI